MRADSTVIVFFRNADMYFILKKQSFIQGEKMQVFFLAVLAIRPGFRCAQLKLSEVVNIAH